MASALPKGTAPLLLPFDLIDHPFSPGGPEVSQQHCDCGGRGVLHRLDGQRQVVVLDALDAALDLDGQGGRDLPFEHGGQLGLGRQQKQRAAVERFEVIGHEEQAAAHLLKGGLYPGNGPGRVGGRRRDVRIRVARHGGSVSCRVRRRRELPSLACAA